MTSIDYAKYRALIREPGLDDGQKDELITQLHTILVTLVDRILTTSPVDKSGKFDAGKPCNPLDSKPYLTNNFKARAVAKAGDLAGDTPKEDKENQP
jgi:hypothetical protein